MKKRSLYTAGIIWALMMSCSKDKIESIQQQVRKDSFGETSGQLLTKIIRTTFLGDVLYDEDIKYGYDRAGKIISEGEKTYVRDDQQRIVRIYNSNICDGRRDTKVYYSERDPGEISYTICPLDAISATDSVVYVHDKGCLIKTMSYIHYLATTTYPEHTSLEKYNVFKYDDEGNLSKVNLYSISPETGDTIRCGQFVFKDYYKTANPLYTTDEVRTFQLGYSGLINSSKNNFFSLGDYTKDYEYRADGRPRICTVKYNGSIVYKLTFVYN